MSRPTTSPLFTRDSGTRRSPSRGWNAFERRSYYLATYFPTDERLDNLLADPRFTDFTRRCIATM